MDIARKEKPEISTEISLVVYVCVDVQGCVKSKDLVCKSLIHVWLTQGWIWLLRFQCLCLTMNFHHGSFTWKNNKPSYNDCDEKYKS